MAPRGGAGLCEKRAEPQVHRSNHSSQPSPTGQSHNRPSVSMVRHRFLKARVPTVFELAVPTAFTPAVPAALELAVPIFGTSEWGGDSQQRAVSVFTEFRRNPSLNFGLAFVADFRKSKILTSMSKFTPYPCAPYPFTLLEGGPHQGGAGAAAGGRRRRREGLPAVTWSGGAS